MPKNVVTEGSSGSAAQPGHTKLNYFFLLLSAIYKETWGISVFAWFRLVAGVVYAYRTTVRKRPHQRRQVPWSNIRRGKGNILAKCAPPRMHRWPHPPPCL